MKRLVIQTHKFSSVLDKLIASNKLRQEDYDDFEKQIIVHPELGDVVPGTGGLRKTRIKSASKGKSGGFRVYYCDFPELEVIYLLTMYAKNVQSDLTNEEKKACKAYADSLKKELKKRVKL